MTTSQMRRWAGGAVAITALLALAACSTGSAQGFPSPTSDAGGSATSSARPVSGPSTRSLNPCHLLDSATVTSLGLQPGVVDNTQAGLGARACQYHGAVDHEIGLGIDLWDHKGLTDLNFSGDHPQKITVGSHQGYEVQGTVGAGSCEIDLAVGPHSVADALGESHSDTAAACQMARTAAEAMEPALPAYGN
jgi:hypothetical protein